MPSLPGLSVAFTVSEKRSKASKRLFADRSFSAPSSVRSHSISLPLWMPKKDGD